MTVNVEAIYNQAKQLKKAGLDFNARLSGVEQYLLTKESGFVQTLVDKGVQKDDAFVAWFGLSPMASQKKTFEGFKQLIDTLESNPREFSTTMQQLRDNYLVESGSGNLKVFLAENRYKNEAFNTAFENALAETKSDKADNGNHMLFKQNKEMFEQRAVAGKSV